MCGYEFETMGGKFEPLLKMNLTTKEGKSTPGDLSKIRLLFRKKVELTDMLVFYVLDWVCVLLQLIYPKLHSKACDYQHKLKCTCSKPY